MLRARTVLASLVLSFAAVAGCAPAPGEDADGAGAAVGSSKGLFDSGDPALDVTIAFSKKALFVRDEQGIQDATEVAGTLKAPSLGLREPVPITVKVRGNTSLIDGECSFPKLSFKLTNKADAASSAFEKLGRIKIATHCGELAPSERTPFGRVANEVSPHREAFVYQVLRVIGLEAPRARPVTITYVDGEGEITRKAAFIEDVDDVARRLGGKESFVVEGEADAIDETDERAADCASIEKMKADEVARVHFAEALIANDDWRLNGEPESRWLSPDFREALSFFWNMKAVRMPDGTERPIPVDFDLSRIVAPQSGKTTQPEIWSGRDRALHAQFALLMHERMRLPRAQLEATRREFLSKKDAILATLDTPWLDTEGRASAKTLFDNFFAVIGKDESFYVPVVDNDDLEILGADGNPDDTCITNTIPRGTPVHRYGVENAALGLEQVSLLDVAVQLPCNKERVWVQKSLRVATSFPAP